MSLIELNGTQWTELVIGLVLVIELIGHHVRRRPQTDGHYPVQLPHTHTHTHIQTHRLTDRQTDTQTHRQTDRQTDRQTHRLTDRLTDRHTETHTETHTRDKSVRRPHLRAASELLSTRCSHCNTDASTQTITAK